MGNKQVKSVSQLASLCSDSLATLKKDKNDKAVHSDENEEHCKIINGTVQAMKNVILGKPISRVREGKTSMVSIFILMLLGSTLQGGRVGSLLW